MRFSHVSRAAVSAAASAGALAALVLVPRVVHAQNTIAENIDGTLLGSGGYRGQSFTLTSGGTFTNIAFNFSAPVTGYGVPAAPVAFGTGFLFSSEYLGAPSALSAATPGYLGQAAAAGGFYNFGTTVVLTGGTKYYFYENGLIPNAAITGGNTIIGGSGYFTSGNTANFTSAPQSANFRVTGTATPNAVPEPGVWVTAASLAGTTLFGMARGRRRMCKEAKQAV